MSSTIGYEPTKVPDELTLEDGSDGVRFVLKSNAGVGTGGEFN